MSRFHCEWDGEGPPPEFWQQAVKNAIRGKRGQAILRELRNALLALPNSRLIEGSVVKDGEVCAIGALAAYRLTVGPVTHDGSQLTSLVELEEQFAEWLNDEVGTVELGQSMGLTRALAWAISYENDEGTWKDETPEERFRRVLDWVERELTEK